MRLVLAAALAAAALSSSPAVAAEPPLKAGSVLHLTSKKHAHPYSLFVPSEYSAKVSWPVVISSHGRDGSGKGEIGQWTGLAGKHGFIVACPDMCTATVNRPPTSSLAPEAEDEQVLLSIFEEIASNFRVNRRAVMITGFSGGGNPSYWTGLRHPDVFTHIATRGGNFAPQQMPTDEKLLAAGRKRIQVYIYFGDNDHPLILGEDGKPGQAQMAYDALKKAGYENLKFEKIAGMGHASRPDLAAGWFGAHLVANRKMFLAGDKADEMLAEIREGIAKERWKDAVRGLLELEKHEQKAGVPPVSGEVREKLTKVAADLVEQAKKAHEAGENGEANKLIGRVVRDFKGLAPHEEARGLEKEWKEPPPK
ncbi:MAG: alpha/beta hydrolase-fold protein [Planctomycetes bacterium]|jgi:S-formylglutathione hydrolase FrmB|nr:alpha/beta hydrolase-fold protein [Planctomycetota bacterium]